MTGTRSGGSKGTPRSKKKVVTAPTLSEWELAMKEVAESAPSGEGFTVSEVAEETGISAGRIRTFLQKLIREGGARAVPGGKRGVAISGRACVMPSYVLVKKK